MDGLSSYSNVIHASGTIGGDGGYVFFDITGDTMTPLAYESLKAARPQATP